MKTPILTNRNKKQFDVITHILTTVGTTYKSFLNEQIKIVNYSCSMGIISYIWKGETSTYFEQKIFTNETEYENYLSNLLNK
jgi:hypothetical protein